MAPFVVSPSVSIAYIEESKTRSAGCAQHAQPWSEWQSALLLRCYNTYKYENTAQVMNDSLKYLKPTPVTSNTITATFSHHDAYFSDIMLKKKKSNQTKPSQKFAPI